MNNPPPARYMAAQVSERLLRIVKEIIMEHEQGKPKDSEKYGMVSDLIVKFGTIADVALQQEENSKSGIEFLHKISTAVDDALEIIDPLMDEFYVDNIVTFEDFRDRALALIDLTKSGLSDVDVKTFLMTFHAVEENRRDLEYIPYTECGWTDNELDMCDGLLENLDMFFVELSKKHDRLLGKEFVVH